MFVIMKNFYHAGKPGPPSALQVGAVLRDSISLSWMEPVSTGGTEIIGYIVERKKKNVRLHLKKYDFISDYIK